MHQEIPLKFVVVIVDIRPEKVIFSQVNYNKISLEQFNVIFVKSLAEIAIFCRTSPVIFLYNWTCVLVLISS